MKAKSLLLVAVVAVIACTVLSGSFVQAFDRFFSFRSVSETGDVYRVQRRAEAYHDGTIVVHERSRLLHDSCDVSTSCDRGWSYSEPRTYSRDADAGSCDHQHYRLRRPLYR